MKLHGILESHGFWKPYLFSRQPEYMLINKYDSGSGHMYVEFDTLENVEKYRAEHISKSDQRDWYTYVAIPYKPEVKS